MWMSRWSRLLVALVICVAALGCGGSAGKGGGGSPAQQSDAAATDAAAQQSNGTPGSPGGSPQGQAGGAPGAPGAAGSGNRGNVSKAIGAPVKIPAFTQIGSPGPGFIDKVHQEIKDAIRKGCKPRPADCIRTVVKQRPHSELNPDCFAGTYPPTNTATTSDEMVELDPRKVTVLVVYSGSDPARYSCKEEESSSESNVDQQPTDNTTAPTDTSQQPTDNTTAPTDTSQSEPPSS
jgi:hypothetical protein